MGILDDAIREHLELKRQHGVGDSELKQLEDEAFGPPERPGGDEPPPDPFAEAPTEFMAAPETAEEQAPAEGEAQSRRETPGIADLQEAPPPAEPAEEEQPAMEHEIVPETPQPAARHSTEEHHAIAEQPTEMYDVEGEIAATESSAPSDEEALEDEDDEDFFDEQRLSDELDQALEAPVEEDEPEADVEVEEEEVVEEDEEESVVEERAHGRDSEEDVLEDTPDFLEDAPEDDQLWFEQKPPKDFDFDD